MVRPPTVEERPDLSTIWDQAEAYSLAIPAFFLCLGLLSTTIYFAVDESRQSTLSWMRPPDMGTFHTLLITFGASALVLVLSMYPEYPIGLLAWYGGVNVAITRKITHIIFISALPLTMVLLNQQGEGLARDMFLAMVWQSLTAPHCYLPSCSVRHRVRTCPSYASPSPASNVPKTGHTLSSDLVQPSGGWPDHDPQIPMIQWMACCRMTRVSSSGSPSCL